MTIFGFLFIIEIFAFISFFSIPFLDRRFGKFLPADAGTALVRSFHIPRFAKTRSPLLSKRRKKLWIRLLLAALFWAISGSVLLNLLIVLNCPLTMFILLWFCALAACVDEKLHLLPDILTLPLLIFGFYFSTSFFSTLSPAASAGGAIFGFLLPTLTSALMTPFFPRSLGGGDFKMLTALGSWLGFLDLFVVICFSVIYFAVFAVIRKKKTGPYGFSLFISVITVLVLRHFGLTDYLIPFL